MKAGLQQQLAHELAGLRSASSGATSRYGSSNWRYFSILAPHTGDKKQQEWPFVSENSDYPKLMGAGSPVVSRVYRKTEIWKGLQKRPGEKCRLDVAGEWLTEVGKRQPR